MSFQTPQTDRRYIEHTTDLILSRLKIAIPVAILFILIFIPIDHYSQPDNATTFSKLRIAASITFSIIFILLQLKSMRGYVVSFCYIAATTISLCTASIIFLTDGSNSRYYEGANIVFLSLSFVIPYYSRRNAFYLFLQISFIEMAMLANQSTFNFTNFVFANYFMIATAVFVYLTSKAYSEQHYKAFIRQEQLKISEAKLSILYSNADKMAKTDELTNIPNRRYFFELVNEQIKKCEADKQTFFIVIFDIDYFKTINDTYGHAFGDSAIIHVAECVKNAIRSTDIIGRYGGDEFVVYMHKIDRDVLIKRLGIIGKQIKQIKLSNNNDVISISVSFGAAGFKPGNKCTAEQLIDLADQELLKIKKTNRGGVSVA